MTQLCTLQKYDKQCFSFVLFLYLLNENNIPTLYLKGICRFAVKYIKVDFSIEEKECLDFQIIRLLPRNCTNIDIMFHRKSRERESRGGMYSLEKYNARCNVDN